MCFLKSCKGCSRREHVRNEAIQKELNILYICHHVVCHYKYGIMHLKEGEMLIEQVNNKMDARTDQIVIMHEERRSMSFTMVQYDLNLQPMQT